MSSAAVAVETIASRILVLHGLRVLLDADLAALYGVQTKRLNEQVKRNAKRFPLDFMFQLTSEEKDQVVANCDHLRNLKFSKALPYVFTEHGALMAGTILNSPRAIEVSVYVVRAFVQLRDLLAGNKDLAQRLKELEHRLERKLAGHDKAIADILAAIRQLVNPPQPAKRPIGFVSLRENKASDS